LPNAFQHSFIDKRFNRSILVHCCSAAIENYPHHICKLCCQSHLLNPVLAYFHFYFLQQYKPRKIRNIVPCTFCCLGKSFSCINKLVSSDAVMLFLLGLNLVHALYQKVCYSDGVRIVHTHCLLNVRNKMRCFFWIGKFDCTKICFSENGQNGEEPTRILFCERRNQCFSLSLHFSLRNFVGFILSVSCFFSLRIKHNNNFLMVKEVRWRNLKDCWDRRSQRGLWLLQIFAQLVSLWIEKQHPKQKTLLLA